MKRDYEIRKYLSDDILRSFPVVNVKKGEIFIPIERQKIVRIYYILEGKVDVFSLSYDGREFLIDQLGEGDFIGKFSQNREINLQCGVRASRDLKMLDMTDYYYKFMKENVELERFFQMKTSNKIYRMYKILMIRMQFRYEEILAYWLLDSMDEENVVTDVDEIFYKMNISDRNVYYLLKRFKEKNLIKKGRNKIKILDVEGLYALAENIMEFMNN